MTILYPSGYSGRVISAASGPVTRQVPGPTLTIRDPIIFEVSFGSNPTLHISPPGASAIDSSSLGASLTLAERLRETRESLVTAEQMRLKAKVVMWKGSLSAPYAQTIAIAPCGTSSLVVVVASVAVAVVVTSWVWWWLLRSDVVFSVFNAGFVDTSSDTSAFEIAGDHKSSLVDSVNTASDI
ncbi:hypothetical protein EDB89DRAFT_1905758 [Lactarius sanguifluus]|nr:hypothetical protein EDB89DRAFT_1905758 [Lactarius sanguifluus]